MSGKVTLSGQPVPDGEIVLRPLDGTPGAGAATKVAEGGYSIAEDKGLVAGKYLVAITATRNNQQYIPDQYNIGSDLTVDLVGGENTKDFALEPGKVTAEAMPAGGNEEVPPPPSE